MQVEPTGHAPSIAGTPYDMHVPQLLSSYHHVKISSYHYHAWVTIVDPKKVKGSRPYSGLACSRVQQPKGL